MSKLVFRVKYKAKFHGNELEGIEEECSWFMIDQRGKFYEYGPLSPPKPADPGYSELTALIKIGDEYLSVDEIESRLKASEESARRV